MSIISKFTIGRVFLSEATSIDEKNLAFHNFIRTSIKRHFSGDFGDLCEEDKEANEEALREGYRIMSVYNIPEVLKAKIKDNYHNKDKLWIITEADRTATTILYPSEY